MLYLAENPHWSNNDVTTQVEIRELRDVHKMPLVGRFSRQLCDDRCYTSSHDRDAFRGLC